MCYVSPVWSTGRFMAVLWVFMATGFSLYKGKPTAMALMDYSGIHRSRGCLTDRGLSQVSLYMPTTDWKQNLVSLGKTSVRRNWKRRIKIT